MSKNNKRRIKLKIKKARKVFSTVISRGSNPEANKKEVDEPENPSIEATVKDTGHLTSALANFALVKQLDGALDFEEGTTAWWSQRAGKGYGAILAKDYDFNIKNGSKEDYINFLKTPIPKEALDNALRFRTAFYERLTDSNDVIKSLFSAPVQICFKIFKSIYNSPKGLVPEPNFWMRSKGGHSVSVVKYHKDKKLIQFINSWGKDWGDNGFGYISKNYFDRNILEAWVSKLKYGLPEPSKGSIKIIEIPPYRYEMLGYASMVQGRQPIRVIDVYIGDLIIGWAHLRLNDNAKILNIEDIFVKPDYRNQGVATKMLDFIEKFAESYLIPQIVCYVHVMDLVSEENKLALENLFKPDFYEMILDSNAFSGCVLKFVRNYDY